MITPVNNTVSHPAPVWQNGAQSKTAEYDKPILQDSTLKALEGAAAPVKQQLYFKEGEIQSPLSRAVSASGYEPNIAQQLVTYNASGRLTPATQSVYSADYGRNLGSVVDVELGVAGGSSGNVSLNKATSSISGDQNNGSNSEEAIKNKKDQHSEEQVQEEVRNLASRDREVRNHEQAHAASGGAFAGSPSYEFQRGPDGISYAVGGEVAIDVGKAATPQDTIAKAQTVRRAALAPAEPSPQDRRVAQQATQLEAEARRDLLKENSEKADAILTSDRAAVDATRSASETEKSNNPSSESSDYVSEASAVSTENKTRSINSGENNRVASAEFSSGLDAAP